MSYGTEAVTVRFGDVVALDRVTVSAGPGTVSAVVGGDGAGKSTLLRTVVGRIAPDTGRVIAPDIERIGYQPASGGSWPDLTVAENMAFVGSSYGLRGRALVEKSAALLERAGLGSARDRLARDLSGGMRTKLGFCLAILHEPELLVLDEPSTGVDPVSRVELWRLMSEAAADGAAVLISTSYMDEAERCATVLVLEQGRTLLSGPPREVVDSSPGVVVLVETVTRPEYSWRHADGFREWWPAPPDGQVPIDVDLEDVAIVASLANGSGREPR